MNKLYHDITRVISPSMAVWPGDQNVVFSETKRIADGDVCNLTVLKLSVHTGTHIDAPKHFIDGGLTMERLPLECFLGKAAVYDLRGRERITRGDLEKLDIEANGIVIFKTDNSEKLSTEEFRTDYVHLTLDAAAYLAGIPIRTVGIDGLSIECYKSDGNPVHHALLGAGVVIIEGLDLKDVAAGEYQITALPLKLQGGNGSPARVVLMEERPDPLPLG